MKTGAILPIILLAVFIQACSHQVSIELGQIREAMLKDYGSDAEVRLSDEKIDALRELVRNGLVSTTPMRWQVWKSVKITYRDGKTEVISFYEDRYLKLRRNGTYCRVKRSYMPDFLSIARADETEVR